MCMTEQEAVTVEEIDEEEEEVGSIESTQGANEEDTDEYYFEDPSNIGNYMQHAQQYVVHNTYTKGILMQLKSQSTFSYSTWSQFHSSSSVPRLCQADGAGKT